MDEAPIFIMVIEMLIESLHQKLQQLVWFVKSFLLLDKFVQHAIMVWFKIFTMTNVPAHLWTVCYRGYFDHHLTTTVQQHRKMPKKSVVTTTSRLFLVLGATVQN